MKDMKASSFEKGRIEGVVIKEIKKFLDERGWLCELFREDELEASLFPRMSYVSLTYPGIVRGPHAHLEQTDLFCFIGPGNFELRLWDNRPDSKTFRRYQAVFAGKDSPKSVLVPPGVVHGYRCLGKEPGIVFNAPNRLYAGHGRLGPVDEIRYEDDPGSAFKF